MNALVELPQNAVTLRDDHPVTTSLRVADIFGKQHKNVRQRIANLMRECPPEFARLNFKPTDYIDKNGDSQPVFELTRDAFTLLVMGFTGPQALAFKLAFIERFNALEAQQHRPASIGFVVPPVLSLGEYIETRDHLHDLRAELDVLFNQLEQVDVRVKPAEIEAMNDPAMRIGKRVMRVRDVIAITDAHNVPRKVVEEIAGIDNNCARQHAHLAKNSKKH